MSLVTRYFQYIDADLADLHMENRDQAERGNAMRDLFQMPVFLVGVPCALLIAATACLIKSELVRDIGVGIFTLLFVSHLLIVFWRWSIFDYEDFSGKKLEERFEGRK